MAWVVKTWRTDALSDAERRARGLRRLAERELADAETHLAVLEDLGHELMHGLRERRRPEPKFKRSRLRESPLAGLFQSTDA